MLCFCAQDAAGGVVNGSETGHNAVHFLRPVDRAWRGLLAASRVWDKLEENDM